MKIHIDNISKSFGAFPALNDVTLTVPSGELMALLGPSGSGKTTLLRVIAGLETPEKGNIFFGPDDVTELEVKKRNIGFVFQHYALFPHMSVSDNIAFGLKVRGMEKKQIKERVSQLLNLMQLSNLGTRLPSQLSGGQRQRVALARALAPKPQVLLLDEPFGALDARVRQDLRCWLRRLHDEIFVTTIFVTHDQEEAFEVADMVAILNNGKIEQKGQPDEVFDRPANAFIMDFIGNINILKGFIKNQKGSFENLILKNENNPIQDGPANAYIRSQDIELCFKEEKNTLAGTISHIKRIGLVARISVLLNKQNQLLTVELPNEDWKKLQLSVQNPVWLKINQFNIFSQ